jgi:hypothetical protein
VFQHHGRPVGLLEAINEYEMLLPLTSQTVRVVTILDKETDHIFLVAVNLENGETKDLVEAKADEMAAREMKYGKLDPMLYERLDGQPGEFEICVLIRVAPIDFATVYTELQARHPEADPESLPFLVVNSDSDQILNDYRSLLSEAILGKKQPLVEYLSSQDLAVSTSSFLPAVQVTLKKEMIEEIANREDVQYIFLGESNEQLVLDSAIPSAHAPEIWDTGVDGSGELIAIVEFNCVGKPGGDPPDWVAVDGERPPACPGYDDHPSRIATAAASFHDTHPGIARGAHVLSAWRISGDANDMINSFIWASTEGAQILNMSTSYESGTPDLLYLDWAVDYHLRHYQPFVTIVVGAGNLGGYVGSPGKAYNVITVGGTDDMNSARWSDDTMWGFSAWEDPASGDGVLDIREKPDIVAVAANLEGTGSGSTINAYPFGTSYATAQVSGLVALILQHSSGWEPYNQFAMKAILMASATNNIVDSPVCSDADDCRDGAGAINARAAIEIASNVNQPFGSTCDAPCYGYHNLSDDVFNGQPLDIGSLWAVAGEQIRVATQWFSDPASVNGPDNLNMVLQTEIVAPSGSVVALTQLQEPAHLLSFYAQENGVHTIRVRQLGPSGENNPNHLGWAWTRIRPYDATYPKYEVPACVEYVSGSTFDVGLTVRNEGYVEWSASYERLGYRWYEGYPPMGAPVAEDSDVTSFGSPLFWYGDVEDVSAAPQMPTGVSPGLYTLRWDMVSHQAGGAEYWFSEQFADEPLDIPIILGSSCHAVYLPLVLRE